MATVEAVELETAVADEAQDPADEAVDMGVA